MTTPTMDDTVPDTTVSADEAALRAQGHKGELPRQFSAFSALSLAFVITNSWIGYAAVFVTPLLAGGGPAVFWGVIVSFVVCTLITLGMAELASAFPSSGGQYHFTFMVSSPKTKAAGAFVTGWLSALAWCLTATSGASFTAQIVMAIASFDNPNYVAERWQVYLVFLLITILACAIVCLLPKLLPKLEEFFFWCSILAFLVTSIACVAMNKNKEPASTVFTTYTNQTGWSDGTSFMIGLGSCMYIFVATDAATHIAEEVPNPGHNIPRVMWMTPLIGIVTTLLFLLATLFSATDLDAISASALPILTLYSQATNSTPATIFFSFWLLLNYFGATIGCITTSGRLTWAFARDNGVWYSSHVAKVDSRLETPVVATVCCSIFIALYGLIYIGSTTAFNSIVSMSILSLNLTYVIPQGIVLFRGRDKVLPARALNLGRFGPVINAISCLWVAVYVVIFCLPVFVPPTVNDMNYLSPVAVGIVLLILVAWYGGKRKTFTGPNVQFDQGLVTEGVSLAGSSDVPVAEGEKTAQTESKG
ncbi:putative amino acid permease [Exophiala viscosa]|uniref:Amino acid permease n=1 Tax=Exophiala viscosa TaxID=2486360 RepID=A0AAN6DVJ8_9EURO|nr:putative amino acid permease [Exophiala viscosa]